MSLPEPAVVGPDTPVRPGGGPWKSMVRVGGILDDVSRPAQAALVINVVGGG